MGFVMIFKWIGYRKEDGICRVIIVLCCCCGFDGVLFGIGDVDNWSGIWLCGDDGFRCLVFIFIY